MNKKTVAFCCFAWVGAILTASPANAMLVSTLDFPTGTPARVSEKPVVISEVTWCDGLAQTYYAQRMNIGGVSMMFNTDQEYASDPRLKVVFVGTCSDGTNIYELITFPKDAASSYRELAQLASLDRLNSKANTQLAEYRSPLRRDEPDSNPPAPPSALAAEDRRRHSPRFLLTARG